MDIKDYDLDVADPAHVPIVLRSAAHWYAALAEQQHGEGNFTLARKWQAMADLMQSNANFSEDVLARIR